MTTPTPASPLRRALALALAAATSAGAPVSGQAPPPERERPVFGVQASAVMVDVVVRDKKGRVVRDLSTSDFEVYEDGVRQAIQSFRVVDNGPPAEERAEATATPPPGASGAAPLAPAAAAPAAAAPTAPAHPVDAPPAVVAFVFDRLSPNARDLARKAALSFTDRNYVAGDLVAVYTIDLALHALQPFTGDLERIRAAVERAGSQANTPFASERQEARDREDNAQRAGDALAALSGSGSGGTSGGNSAMAGVYAVQQLNEQMQANIIRAFDAMERDQQGHATTNGLLAVVNGLRPIPGRKTVIFFSEGISIPSSVEVPFRSVIASANRANVSVYSIDSAGLRLESETHEEREELIRNAQARLRQEEAAGSGRPTREALNRSMERNEDALRLNPESGLGQLADETGGFLLRDTNDIRSAFRRIGEDMRFHYLLSYSPTNAGFDGTFRTISVKVRRPDLRVQSRKGYFAVRPEYVLPVRGYEAAALVALDRSPAPQDFPMGAGALSFPEKDRPGLVPVLVSVPGGAIRWEAQPPAGAHADFSIVVRIKDERGQEADRLSQDYRLSAPADKLEAARRGDVLFYREANLPPGRYTAEAVTYDALAHAASVRTSRFEVPRAEEGHPRLSSLVLVSRAEKLTAEEQSQKSPLHFGEAMLYPSLGLPFRKSAVPAVGFYFSVYGKGASAGKATVEVRQGAKVVARTTFDLPAPDASGRIQHAGALPLKAFAPGDYALSVSVGEGASALRREAEFTVVE
jgi:VWFA-related protein